MEDIFGEKHCRRVENSHDNGDDEEGEEKEKLHVRKYNPIIKMKEKYFY
jgi:hypothetical protein